MKHTPFLVAGAALWVVAPDAAFAQRAEENAVETAEDAFGTSVGNERVGLYFPQSARGFSPIQAGNVRINGMYMDYQADLNQRLVSGSTVRVGLTAQGYPFPAPTGVADFALRLPGSDAVASVVGGIGPYGQPRIEVDAQFPVTANLGLAGGFGITEQGLHLGGKQRIVTAAAIARWKPTNAIELTPFWSVQRELGGEGQLVLFPGGSYLPPRIPRRRYFGPSWAENDQLDANMGLLGTARMGDWTLRAGAFRSIAHDYRNFATLFRNVTPDGFANRETISDPSRRFASTSGELRVTRQAIEGERLHVVHLMARGRMQNRRNGGATRFDFGPGRIDEQIVAPEPIIAARPQTNDAVRQTTFGVGYEGRWRGVGELSLGIQRASYRKSVVQPSGPLPVSRSNPWLFNGTASILAGKDLVFYAGYSKGLEESPVAPDIAVNRGEAPPAIITRQMDAGLRYDLSGKLKLVAGVFDVRKPYFALDPGLLFRELGEVRNRGVELSLAGSITPRLNIVLGALLLDASVSGDQVELGLIGPKPIGSTGRTISGAINWEVPWIEGLSLDANIDAPGNRVADRANTFVIPSREVVSVGGRYRFDLYGKPASLRVQVPSINDVYGFSNAGEGFVYNPPRRFQASLTVDL